MEQWEYLTIFLDANATVQSQYLNATFPEFKGNFRPFAPQALMPFLNDYGAQGWEMIACHPYTVGVNLDVMTHVGTDEETNRGQRFTHRYFCVFKRRKQSA